MREGDQEMFGRSLARATAPFASRTKATTGARPFGRILLLGLAAFGLAAIATMLYGALAPRVPLYLTLGCPGPYCEYPNTPRVPLLPLLAGAGYGFLLGGVKLRSLVVGVAVGLATSLVATLFVAAAIPLKDPYFVSLYRVYGIAYLFAVLSLLSFVFVRRRALVHTPALWPIAAAMLLGIGVAWLRQERVLALAGLVGVLLGSGVARALRELRLPVLTASRSALVVALAAFVTRAGFGLLTLARTGPGMAFAIASDDGDSYYTLASSLAHDVGKLGDVLGARAFPPGYSTFLAAIFAVTGESLAIAIVLQALLAAVATLVVYWLGRALMDRATGLLAAALFAFDQNLIQNESTLTAEALLVPALLVSLYGFARYRHSESKRWLALAAATLGLAFITRNVAAIPLLVAALIWLSWWRRRDARALLRDAGVMVAAVLIAALPIAVASYVKDGTPRLTTQLAGLAWEFEGGGITIPNTFLVQRQINPFDDPMGSLVRVLADPIPVAAFYANVVPQRVSTLLFFLSPGSANPLVIANPLIYPNPFGDTITLLRVAGLVVALIAVLRTRWWLRVPELPLVAGYFALYLAVFAFVFPPYHPFRYRIPGEPIRFIAEAAGLLLIGRATWQVVSAELHTLMRRKHEQSTGPAVTTPRQIPEGLMFRST